MYGTVTQIQITPNPLIELVRGVVRSALASYLLSTSGHSDPRDSLTHWVLPKLLHLARDAL